MGFYWACMGVVVLDRELEDELALIARENGLGGTIDAIRYLVEYYRALRPRRVEAYNLLNRLEKEYVRHCIGNTVFNRLLRLLRWLAHGPAKG